MSQGGTIPSPLLCAGGALVPAAAAGDGPRARLDKPKNVARDGLRPLEPQRSGLSSQRESESESERESEST